MVVVWSNSAKAELRKAFDYIALDSLQNVQMVRDTLIDLTIDLTENPEKHPLDKLKKIMMALGGPLKNIIIGFPIVSQKIRFVLYVCGIPVSRRLPIDFFVRLY